MTATTSASMAVSTTVPPRGSGRRDRLVPQVLSALLLVVVITTLALLARGRFDIGVDFRVFRTAGSALLRGESPYDFSLDRAFMFIYTPFAAIPLVPLALLNFDVALALWIAASVLAMQAVAWISLSAAGVESPRRRATLMLIFTVAALPLIPVTLNLWFGQINMFLVLLVLADLTRRSGRFRGIGVGIAAGIKLTPLIFIGYLLITRQYRAARTATLTFATTVLAGFAVLPEVSWHYWRGMFADTSRMYPVGADPIWNHSLRGLVAMYASSDRQELVSWLLVAAVVGIGGLAVARLASLRGHEFAGIVACGITGVLVSPLSWPAHWVWCVPLLVLAAGPALPGGRPGRAPRVVLPTVIWLVFAALTYYWIPAVFANKQAWPIVPWEVFTHLIVLTGVAVLAVLAGVVGRPGARPPGAAL